MTRIIKLHIPSIGGEELAFPECPFAGMEVDLGGGNHDVYCKHSKKTVFNYCGSYHPVGGWRGLIPEECPYDAERRKNVLEAESLGTSTS